MKLISHEGDDDLVMLDDVVIDQSRERAERLRSDHYLADLARAYCAAMHANKSAEPRDWEARAIDVDRAYYDLMVACGYFEVDE